MGGKRFLLFTYDQYYPGGGSGDVLDSFDTLDAAIAAAEAKKDDYAEVLDMDAREFVWEQDSRVHYESVLNRRS